MASFVLTRENLGEYKARFDRLADGTARQWGQMNPSEMLRHLRRITEISLAEVPVEDGSSLFSRTIFCWLVFHVLPWPKGKIKVTPVFLPQPEGAVDHERGKFYAALDRFLEAAEKTPSRRTVHPMFGARTMQNWRLIHGKHFDHHLRQFGC